MHTYEKLGASPEVLLGLYRDLARRFPEARIYNELRRRDLSPVSREQLNVVAGNLKQQLNLIIGFAFQININCHLTLFNEFHSVSSEIG